MKVKQKLDKILDIANEKVEEEVSALIGAQFKLTDFSNQLVSKEDYFYELTGKKVFAKMDLSGEIEGKGGIVVDAKDGIRIGGILIMLPQAELEEVIKNEEYTEEIEDSYGEIANIIAGSFTKVFEENYSKSFRFIRKEQEILSPMKVEIEGEEPIPDQYYYLVRAQMEIDGGAGGDLDFLMPAEPFGLEIPQKAEAQSAGETADSAPSPEKDTVQAVQDSGEVPQPEVQAGAADAPVAAEEQPQQATEPAAEGDADSLEKAGKQKKLLDRLLTESSDTYAKEVSALLGVDVKLSELSNSFVDKEQFFLDEVSGKQVIADMDIVDGLEGRGYLCISLKDAIRIGSILIMLPPSELDAAVNEEDFSPDAEDAYGEIANIIAGGFTAIFQDQYTESIRFVRQGLTSLSPMKVDISSDDVMPCKHYYMSRSRLEIDGTACGHIEMLLPVDLFGLTPLVADAAASPPVAQEAQPGAPASAPQASGGAGRSVEEAGPSAPVSSGEQDEDYDILIIQNNRTEAEKIAQELKGEGVTSRIIGYNDSIKYFIRQNLRLVFIVMDDVDEQSYSVTIKVNTLSSVPIVAAGAGWTRSKVIKAVKYGVQDILLIPATPDEIREKLSTNILAMAA